VAHLSPRPAPLAQKLDTLQVSVVKPYHWLTMLGASLNTGSAVHADALRPGWVAVRRMKVLVVPCVPFCVSLFGAYTAYWSALAAQQKAAGIT